MNKPTIETMEGIVESHPTKADKHNKHLGVRRRRVIKAVASSLLLLSLAAPAGGQYILVAQKNEKLAALLYSVGLAAFLSMLILQWQMSPDRRPFRISAPRLPKLQAFRILSGVLSAIFLLVSLATIHTASARVTLGAWVISLLLALVAAIPSKMLFNRLLACRQWVLLGGWRTRETAIVSAIVLVGAVLRLYNLEGIPSGIHSDETGEALVAVSILEGKGPNPFGTAFFGDRALSFYVEALYLAVFGRTVTAMRLYSAVAGVATLPVFYILMRRLFGIRPALISLALLAGCAAHVHYSHIATRVNQIPLLTCISLYFLRRGQESQKAFWWLASGILGGFAVHMAFGGALVVVTIASYFLYLLATRRSNWRAWITGGAITALGIVMTLLPILVYTLGQNDPYTEHTTSRLIFSNWEWITSTHHTSTWGGVLLGQLKANILYFFTGHDYGPFYDFARAPLLATILGPFVALGLTLMLLRITDSRYAMLALWYWSVVLLGGVLTINSPQSHRLLPAALPALAGVALVLHWLMDAGPRLVHRHLAPVFLVATIALPVFAGYSDNAQYYKASVQSMPWHQETLQGRYVASLGPGYRAYTLGTPQISFDSSVTRFLAPNVEGDNLVNPGLRLPLAVPSDRDLAFLVFPHMSHYFPLLQSLYPSREIEEIRGADGNVVFTALRVPKAEIARWRGLAADYEGVKRIEPDAATLGESAPKYPTDAVWSGSIYVEREGSYRFNARGPVSELLIDDTPVREPLQLTLWTGWHSIQIKGRLPEGESRVALEWAPADQPMMVVPERLLDARRLAGNLIGVSNADGTPIVERCDRTIGFRDLGELISGQEQASIQWEGIINPPAEGEYVFSLRSTGETSITIDGRPVVTNDGDQWAKYQTTGTAYLTDESHTFSIRYSGQLDGGLLEALWSVPGGTPGVILPEAFGSTDVAE